MITIIDYGLGNVLAFANVYNRLNIPVKVAKSTADLAGATKLVLPGVGAFDHAMERLDQSGMRDTVERLVTHERVPVLGICVGMQMLAKSSDEGKLTGLGWIDGTVRKFDMAKMPSGANLPHMGWNDVKPAEPGGLFKGLENDARFYFLHSYYFECHQHSDILAMTDYGPEFHCAVRHDNVYGVQFHPEKSHHFGSQLLSNFADI
ncbi:imidazole glycerol phosphate synthase subunit HisH [Massilia cavernae]|uniref:Imidazole glycerol phosphate synthase subunit HisH n=1 Tax=Massilia cavernae TaxID=2320864 RepID=A0A418Y6I0_9BURK|nr:imidazole glycerol phosphate synthase subunit HisH [Massilia cavernae]RJG23671.1 imidazole glycerol phosphate synthase subunit HisH [Massilia cavernae]